MKSIAFLAFLSLVSAVPVPYSSFSSSYSYGGEFYGDSSVGIYHKLEEAQSYVAAAEAVPELHSVAEYSTIINFLEEGKHSVETAFFAARQGYGYSSVKTVILQTKLAQEAFYHAYKVAEDVGLSVVAQQALYAAEAVRSAFFFAEHVYIRYYPTSGYSYIRSLIPEYFSKSLFDDSGNSPSWGYSSYFPNSYSSYYPYSSWFSGSSHPSSYAYSSYFPHSLYTSYSPYSSYYPYSSIYGTSSYWPYRSYSSKSSFYGPYSSYLYPLSSIYDSYWPYSSLYGSYGSSYGSSVIPHIYGLFGKSFM